MQRTQYWYQMKHSAAIHEAGHLLMAIILETPWKFATAKPIEIDGEKCDGLVYFMKPKNIDNHIRILLAGYAAESLLSVPISYGSKMEFKEAVKLANGRDEFPRLWAKVLLEQTIETLKAYRRELNLLSDLLEITETITPESIAKYQIRKREFLT